jgi:hypothetical protein
MSSKINVNMLCIVLPNLSRSIAWDVYCSITLMTLCAIFNYGFYHNSILIFLINLSTLLSIYDCNKSSKKKQPMKALKIIDTCKSYFVRNSLNLIFQKSEHIFHNKTTMFVLPIIQL